jgi:hypothetical protein
MRIDQNIPKRPEITWNNTDSSFKVLTRLTACVSNNLQVHKLNRAKVQRDYNLLALEFPDRDETMLSQLCGGQIDCDIVCLEMTSNRLHQVLRKANLNLPRERGIVFELKLYDLLSSQPSRISSISNGRLLVDKCKGRVCLLFYVF